VGLGSERPRYRSRYAHGYIVARRPSPLPGLLADRVVEHVEAEWSIEASVRQIVDRMRAAGCFERARTTCEIGPGTGMYLEKVRHICPDSRYVIYETDLAGAAWLEIEHPVLRREADGVVPASSRCSRTRTRRTRWSMG
jgi:hypothetical protein